MIRIVFVPIYIHCDLVLTTTLSLDRKHRFVIRRLVKSQKFYIAVVVLVLLNTLCVSVEFYGQPGWLTEFLCKILCKIVNVFHIQKRYPIVNLLIPDK